MRVILELARIIIILLFLGGFGWLLIGEAYTVNESAERYQWIAGLGIYVALFVLYRNRLQFSGWYKGKGRKKLSKTTTLVLLVFSIIMIILPLIMSFVITETKILTTF